MSNSPNMNDELLDSFNRVEKLHWWWEGRRTLLKLLLKDEKPKRILDIGCGTGETLTFMKEVFPKAVLYGVDTSDKAIKYSKKRKHKNIYKASAKKLPFKDNYFDVILLLDVIEHIKDDEKVLKEAKRVLVSGGKIVITSPALSFIWSQHDEKQSHQRRYTRTRIRSLARKTGLDVKFISYFNFLLSSPIIAIRLLGKIKALSFLADYDRGINYDIAFNKPVNNILRTVFDFEINKLKYIRYPFGISIAAMLEKR